MLLKNLYAVAFRLLMLWISASSATFLETPSPSHTGVSPSVSLTSEHHHQRHRHQQPTHQQPPQLGQNRQPVCRNRFGSYDYQNFVDISCYFCHIYLIQQRANSSEGADPATSGSRAGVTAASVVGKRSLPMGHLNGNPLNDTCSHLPPADCRRVMACCYEARKCCEYQLRMSDGNASDDDFRCKATWDGFSCWEAAAPGSYERKNCPEFVLHSNPTETAVKYCTPNATWSKNSGIEWTDYTPCTVATYRFHLNHVYTCFGFNAFSISMLLPSIAIFMMFRDLAKQPRIRLHVNFFMSLTLCCFVTIAWYLFVHYEKLTNPNNMDTVIYRNPVWCRFISFLKTYLTSTTYFWMFCEGWYLYRLLSKAFQQPESLRSLYLIGWVTPAVAAAVYSSIRAVVDNTRCWVKNVGGYEWIMYTPNLLCLVLNFVFLCNILRILLFQLHAHPQEPNSFRRGLKAGIMLIPLFGLHLLLTIYRPDLESTEQHSYSYVTLAISNSQGVFVSLIFCFLNGEVISHVCRLAFCDRLLRKDRLARKYASHVTQITMADERRSDTPNSLKNRATCMGSCSGEGLCLQDLSNISAKGDGAAAGGGGGGEGCGAPGGGEAGADNCQESRLIQNSAAKSSKALEGDWSYK